MKKPHCLVIGVGPGTGSACVERFMDGGYAVSMLARSQERLDGFAANMPGAIPYAVDINRQDEFRSTLQRIAHEHGTPKTIIYNATQATLGYYIEIDLGKFERNFRVNAAGLLLVAQLFGPAMAEAGEGALMITGNTGSLRGKAAFVGWSPTKAAQRILAECLARELGPSGVQVAYIVIDAYIDMPFAKRRQPKERPDDFYAKPSDLADEIYHIAHQPRSARSFLVELRPFGESW